MDRNNKNRSDDRPRDSEGRFVSQNQSQGRSSGQRKSGNASNSGGSNSGGRGGNRSGRGSRSNQQPRDADGRFESKN